MEFRYNFYIQHVTCLGINNIFINTVEVNYDVGARLPTGPVGRLDLGSTSDHEVMLIFRTSRNIFP